MFLICHHCWFGMACYLSQNLDVLISPGIVIFREVPLTGLIFTWPGGSALARLCRALLIIGEWCFFGLLTFNMISFIHSSVWSAAKVWLKYRAINLQTTNNCFTSASPPTRRGRPQAAALDHVMALMRIWRQLSLRRGKDGVKFNGTASMTLYGLWLSSSSSYTIPRHLQRASLGYDIKDLGWIVLWGLVAGGWETLTA